jgi:molecular chaperone IbpA
MREFYVPDIYRSMTVGFDEAFKLLETTVKTASKTLGYPPYNIVKQDDNKYVIELAVAGFGKQDLEVEIKENSLVISGKVQQNTNASDYLYKGIADRSFVRQFSLADTVEIKNTQLVNGMLKIFLENIIPEHKKPRKIDIEDTDDNKPNKDTRDRRTIPKPS